jgi:hypothetical protein
LTNERFRLLSVIVEMSESQSALNHTEAENEEKQEGIDQLRRPMRILKQTIVPVQEVKSAKREIRKQSQHMSHRD